MRIINEGNKNKANCYDCGSLLGFEPEDVTHSTIQPHGPYDFDPTDQYTIECPVDHRRIDVTSKITPAIGRRILELEQIRDNDTDVW